MLHEPYGPRGAEDERGDFWTDIPEGADMLPGGLPGGEEDTIDTLADGHGDPDVLSPIRPAVSDPPVVHNQVAGNGRPGDAGFADLGQPPKAMGALGPVEDDPLGSWTGVPADDSGDGAPTQDADDL